MNRLYDLMEERRLTTEMLSEQAGIGVNTISRLRNEDVDCKLSTVIKLSDYFGVTIEEFLNRK